ncbi:MAG TPA: hypothetical protein VLC93_04070, partial [Myxococcota bacterium]|nr:hypothetical protein [Myxococcota bacterium]
MITADAVRAEKPVQTADTTPLTERYGYKGAATPDQIMAARRFCEGLAKECEGLIDEHFKRLRDIGENPYRETINYRNEDNYDRTLRWATRVDLLSKAEFEKRHATAFKGEGESAPVPDVVVLHRTLMVEVRGMYQAAGFAISGPYETNGERFVLMRDPKYVKAREDFEAVQAANQQGIARDKSWRRRLLLMLGAKPFQPLALPPPGP